VKFYLIAMHFILFVPWAVIFKAMSQTAFRPFVFFEMMIFIAVLLVGYIYVWKKGLFEWSRN
jgi:NADH-quinone oxidoreductase subunit A